MVSGIGVDIVSIVDMSGALKRFGGRFKNRLFTEAEQQICEEKHIPSVHYSGKFAAKESFLKALQRENRGGIRWREMEVLNSPGGQPYFRFSGTAGKTLEKNGLRASISLSHSGEYAIAFCLIQKS
ncbi:MAG: holo-ACP synthase [Candidatus Ratteibacteria bacterium]|jgi:holo-[acyl-carrier protein] synthase